MSANCLQWVRADTAVGAPFRQRCKVTLQDFKIVGTLPAPRRRGGQKVYRHGSGARCAAGS
jgi:hypothetical protein